MKLTASVLTYEVADESGYRFTVEATLDPEFGWSASVSMRADGFKTAEDAVARLRPAAERFVQMLTGVR